VALHLHRPALDVIQAVRRDVDVVLDEVALGQALRWKEELVGIGDADLAPCDEQR